MTATTLSRLPLMAGSAVASSLGRAGMWTLSRYMRAPLASTGLLALVTLTALSASNALYFQTRQHPAPFFAPTMVASGPEIEAPVPMAKPTVVAAPATAPATLPQPVTNEITGGVTATQTAPAAIPSTPVGNSDAFAVQEKLAELGLFEGKVDGFYGPMTARAIRAFEERNGLTPTGALSPDIIDAILRADASGRVPQAQPAAAVQVPATGVAGAVTTVAQVPTQAMPPAAAPADRVVARLPPLSPVDVAVDTVGNAAAETIDSIVAAVGGGGNPAPAAQPMPAALPLMATSSQSAPRPVQVASLQPMAAQPTPATQPMPAAQPQPAAATVAAVTTPVSPANNVQLVSDIQRGLASLGFYHGRIDGHPGDATARAIREFENFHSYKVTGQVNPDLIGLLRQAGAAI